MDDDIVQAFLKGLVAMGTSSHIATILDQEFISSSGVTIDGRRTPQGQLRQVTGTVPPDLENRLLVRYFLPHQSSRVTGGSDQKEFVTPTAYSPEEASKYLALPGAQNLRRQAVFINPEEVINEGYPILGPRWVRFGDGIEYILPNGYPQSALEMNWGVWVR